MLGGGMVAAGTLLAATERLVVEVLWRSTIEYVDENATELLPEDAIQDEVDGTVCDDHQATDAGQLNERWCVEHIRRKRCHEDVVDDGRHLAYEEHSDHRDDHHGKVVLAPLAVGHFTGDVL